MGDALSLLPLKVSEAKLLAEELLMAVPACAALSRRFVTEPAGGDA